VNKNLTWVGLIKEHGNAANSKSIIDLMNQPLDQHKKSKVVDYMKRGSIIASCPSSIVDKLEPSIRLRSHYVQADEIYQWNSYLIYYLEKYDVELPEEFVNHVLAQPLQTNPVYGGYPDPN